LLVESSIATLKKSPWLVALYPFWLLQGKGYLKAQLIKHCDIDISTLPYNQTTINYINKRKKAGTQVSGNRGLNQQISINQRMV
jgi:hypothetical protein